MKGSSLVLAWAGGIIMAALAFVTVTDVVFHNTPIPSLWKGGSYELSQLLMGILAASGMSFCWYERGHVRIGLILEHVPPAIHKVIEIVSSLLAMAFVTAVGITVFRLGLQAIARIKETDVLKLPVGVFQVIFAVAMLQFALVLLSSILKSIFRPETDAGPEPL